MILTKPDHDKTPHSLSEELYLLHVCALGSVLLERKVSKEVVKNIKYGETFGDLEYDVVFILEKRTNGYEYQSKIYYLDGQIHIKSKVSVKIQKDEDEK